MGVESGNCFSEGENLLRPPRVEGATSDNKTHQARQTWSVEKEGEKVLA